MEVGFARKIKDNNDQRNKQGTKGYIFTLV